MAFSVISLTFSLLTTGPLQAASATWNGTTDADWATLSNWAGGPVTVPGTGETATFNNAGNGNTTLNLGAGVTVGTVAFDTAAAAAYTIGSGGAGSQTLTLSTAGTALSLTSTVTNSQLINANLALATTGTYISTNDSATGTLSLAGGISASTAGAKFLTLGGAGKTTVSGVVANGTGTLGLNKLGTGTLALTNSNTFTGNVTFNAASSGTIVVANPNALASTAQVNFNNITGNTLEIATDTAVTAIPTNSGTGFAATLVVNRATPGVAVNHTLGAATYGGGTLTLQTGANVTSGTPQITFPTLALNSGSISTATINPTNVTVSIGTATSGINNPTKTLGLGGTTAGNAVTGAITNGSSTGISVNKTGTSTWSLGGVSTYTGATTISAGTLNMSGTLGTGAINVAGGIFNLSGTLGTNTTNGAVRVGTTPNVTGVMNVLPGTVANTRFNLFIGDAGGALTTAGAGGGAIYQSGGSIILTQGANQDNLRIGSNGSGYGYYSLSGGSITTNEAGIGAGLAGTVGVVDVSGGTFTTNGYITLGRGATTSSGLLNVTGGTVAANRIHLDWAATSGATSVMNVGGGGTAAAVTIAPSATLGLDLANSTVAGTVGIANLLTNGTLTTGAVFSGQANPTAIFNINGGTLKAATTNSGVNFLSSANIDNIVIYGSGATIDNSGTNITVSRPLEAASGSGVTAIPVSTGGAGYIGAPMVAISGGGGTGATAYATVNSSGVLTSIVITSAGTGYTSIPTVTLTGGGATTLATLGTVTLGTNTSGGVTFIGSGITSLGAASTYTGATLVTGGTLKLDLNGGVNGSSGITINGSGAKLLQANFDTITAPVTITQGSLDGEGIINTVTVANNAANNITTGAGSNFGLTVGSLTFQGAASVTVTANGSLMERTITATNLATNAAGKITVNITNSAAWIAGDYPVISYSTFNRTISDFQLAAVAGLSPRQTASLVNVGGAITVRIIGDSLAWTGTQNSNWTTAAVGGSQNWILPSGPTGTEFLTNDVVVFDDFADRFNVNIAANVSPSSVIFDNTTTYTFTSTGAFGIAGGKITKNNTGLVILATNNTYTGTTTVNAGTLQIGNGTVDGNINSSSLITSNALVDLNIIGNQTYPTSFAGTGTVKKSGAGSLTLTGTSNFTGGTGGFELGAGTLNVNSASALGTTAGGTLKITGGVLNNTSGGALVTTAAQPQNWAGDFTFTGTNNLSFNSGVVTLSGGGSRTVNVAAGILGTGRLTSPDTGLNLTGTGILAITSAAASNVLGPLDIAAGSKLRLNTGADNATTNDFVTTGITGAGTIENGGGVERWLFVDNATDMTFAGTLQNGAAGPLGFHKNAGGTLVLTGSNTMTGRLTIAAGTLSVPGIGNGGFASALGASAAGADRFYIGNNGGTATLLYTGGDVTSDRGFTLAANTGNSSVIDTAAHLTFTGIVNAINTGGFIKRGTGTLTLSNADVAQKLGLGGNGGTSVFGANVAQGKLELKNGTFTPGGEFVVGGQLQTGGAYTSGNLDVTSGATLTTGNWISIGRGNGDSGIISTLTVDGGVINQTGAGNGLGLGYDAGVAGYSAAPALDIKGASTVTVAGSFFCGESVGANALVTVGGTSTLSLTGVTQGNKAIAVGGKGTLTINAGLVNAGITGFTVARDTGSEGTVNLNGGILASGSTLGGAGTSTLSLNGGTLRADAASAAFLSGFTTANVNAAGAIIDTQAFAITVAQPLSAGTGTGGIAKNGAGTLTFTGVSSYVGNTTVNAGTLALANNAGLKFVVGANTVANKVTGAGTATLDGDFTFDLTAAGIANGNSWTLVDTTAKTFGATFTVNGFSEASDVWTLVDGTKTWTFSEATGVLTLSVSGPAGYAAWINGFGLAAGDKDALDDPDFDGTSNLLEYIFSGNPAVSGGFTRPTGAKSGSNLVLTFNRSDLSLAAGDATLKVEYGNNLAGWTTVTVPAASGTVGAVTFTITDGSPNDTVVASIPVGVDTKFFGRVKAEK